jgi:hypothetical protein
MSDTSQVSYGSVRAGLLRKALVAGFCLAALSAILALLQGDFDDAHWKVVATSLAFSMAAATAAAGDALRAVARDRLQLLVGVGAIVASGAAFLLLLIGLWFDGDEAVWRSCGVAALLALCGSHAALLLRSRRRADTGLITALIATSIATATFDTLVGAVAVLGIVDDVDDDFVRLVAVALVVMLLTTVLVPLLRRVGPVPAQGPADEEGLADELSAIAQRLEALEGPLAVHREAQALRELARQLKKPRKRGASPEVELGGLEPPTSWVRSRRSPN